MIILRGLFTTDIITNSSSTVYTFATGTDHLHKFLTEVLKATGHGKDVDSRDFFVIYVVADRLLDYPSDYLDDEEMKEIFNMSKEEFGSSSEKLEDIINWEKAQEYTRKHNDDPYGGGSTYVVFTLDGVKTDLGRMVFGLAEAVAIYE